jgi:hypothetical protein
MVFFKSSSSSIPRYMMLNAIKYAKKIIAIALIKNNKRFWSIK